MATAAVVGGGRLSLAVGGYEPAGRPEASSRRRTIGLALIFALGAASAGSVLGLVAQQDPNRQRQLEQAMLTASTATELARKAELRAHDADVRAREAQQALEAAKAHTDALVGTGAAQELQDYEEAQKLGLARFMKDSTALWGDDRRRVLAAIVRESRRNGLDPALTAAVIQVESRFDPFAVSHVGACGLMQLMPPTAQWLLDTDDKEQASGKIKAAHLFNPILNIELGTMYLAALMNRFDGDLTKALIAYNAGPGTARQLVRGSKSWKKLEVYPKSVLAAYRTLLTPATPASAVASR